MAVIEESTLVRTFEMLIDQISNLKEDVHSIKDAQLFAECRKYGELNPSIFGVRTDMEIHRICHDDKLATRAPSHVTGIVVVLEDDDSFREWEDAIVEGTFDDILEEIKYDPKAYKAEKEYIPESYVPMLGSSIQECNFVEFRVIRTFLMNQAGSCLEEAHVGHRGAALFFRWPSPKRMDDVMRIIGSLFEGRVKSFRAPQKMSLFVRSERDIDLSELAMLCRSTTMQHAAVNKFKDWAQRGRELVKDSFVFDLLSCDLDACISRCVWGL